MDGCVARCWRLPAGASVCWRRLKTDVAAAGGCWQMPARRGERHLPGRRFHFRRLHGHRGRGRDRGGCHRFEAVRLDRGYALRGSGGGCVDRLRLALPACRGGGADVIDPQDPTQGEAGEAEGLGQKAGRSGATRRPTWEHLLGERRPVCACAIGRSTNQQSAQVGHVVFVPPFVHCVDARSPPLLAAVAVLYRCVAGCVALQPLPRASHCGAAATSLRHTHPSVHFRPTSPTHSPPRPAPPRPSHIPPLAPAQRRSRGPSRGATAGS